MLASLWKPATRLGRLVVTALWVCGALLIGAAIYLAAAYAITWLKTARYVQHTNRDILFEIGVAQQVTNWIGLQRLIDTVLYWPAWSGALIVSIAPILIAKYFETIMDRFERKQQPKHCQQTDDFVGIGIGLNHLEDSKHSGAA